MQIKAIMVDVDGVLKVHPDTRGWSANLERDLGVPVADLRMAFFEPHWNDVSHGRAALRDRLAPVLRCIATPERTWRRARKPRPGADQANRALSRAQIRLLLPGSTVEASPA